MWEAWERFVLLALLAFIAGMILAGCAEYDPLRDCPVCARDNEQGHFGHTITRINLKEGTIQTDPFRWLPDNVHRRSWCRTDK